MIDRRVALFQRYFETQNNHLVGPISHPPPNTLKKIQNAFRRTKDVVQVDNNAVERMEIITAVICCGSKQIKMVAISLACTSRRPSDSKQYAAKSLSIIVTTAWLNTHTHHRAIENYLRQFRRHFYGCLASAITNK